MKIPKNATAAFFDRQVELGTFDAAQWTRWVKNKFNREWEEDPEAMWKKLMELDRRAASGDFGMLNL